MMTYKARLIRRGIEDGRLWYHGLVVSGKPPWGGFWYGFTNPGPRVQAYVRTIRTLNER